MGKQTKIIVLTAILFIGGYLFLSANRYEPDPNKRNARFDKWTGEWEYKHKFEGKYRWFTAEEFNNRYK